MKNEGPNKPVGRVYSHHVALHELLPNGTLLYIHPPEDAVRDAALEEAAQECERQYQDEGECPERAMYCADAIRALRRRAA